MSSKRKVFLYGGCDLHDIAASDILQREYNIINSRSNVNVNYHSNIDYRIFPSTGTSLLSLYSQPGAVADRILNSILSAKQSDLGINREIVNEILKFPYLKFYKDNAGPDDYLLISFSPELYTKFFKSSECFTCFPIMASLKDPRNLLHWIYKDYLVHEQFLLPFDTRESLTYTSDLMSDFARDIYEIFQDRVILVKTHLSNLVISSDSTVKEIKPNCEQILYYRSTKIMSDPTNHDYATKLTTVIMNKFRHVYKQDLNLIELNEPVFIDNNHRWGFAQFHIDQSSRNKIAKLIHESISSHVVK